jgi:hypothetical protein
MNLFFLRKLRQLSAIISKTKDLRSGENVSPAGQTSPRVPTCIVPVPIGPFSPPFAVCFITRVSTAEAKGFNFQTATLRNEPTLPRKELDLCQNSGLYDTPLMHASDSVLLIHSYHKLLPSLNRQKNGKT